MKDERAIRLAALAAMLRERDLAALSREVQACADIRARLDALDAPHCEAEAISPLVMEATALLHERWVSSRRRALYEQLATRTAARLLAESKARASFGRAQVLDRLSR
jgi:hypothetical protein